MLMLGFSATAPSLLADVVLDAARNALVKRPLQTTSLLARTQWRKRAQSEAVENTEQRHLRGFQLHDHNEGTQNHLTDRSP